MHSVIIGSVATEMPDPPTDLKVGELDALGVTVQRIFSREAGKYTIYETAENRVAIDGPDSERCNHPGIHQAMMTVADITIHNPALKGQYNSRIAHAYKIALDGDGKTCESALREIAEDMSRHISRVRQRAYQLGALIGVLIPPISFLTAYRLWPLNELALRLFTASVFAALGGFFSVLLGIRQLDLDLKENFGATMTHGIFRIVIAVISGIVVVYLIRANLLLGPLNNPTSGDTFALACFLTGFSERLVPNVLKRFETTSRARR
jgi:hypothetical protein